MPPSNCRFICPSGFRGEHWPGELKNGGELRCSTFKSGKSVVGVRGKKKIYVKGKRSNFI